MYMKDPFTKERSPIIPLGALTEDFYIKGKLRRKFSGLKRDVSDEKKEKLKLGPRDQMRNTETNVGGVTYGVKLYSKRVEASGRGKFYEGELAW